VTTPRLLRPSVAGLAPFGALLLVATGGAALGSDVRVPVPWLVAGAAALLALCCLGIVAAHAPPPPRLALGGWASAFGFGALALAQVLLGFEDPGDLVGATGPIAELPVLLLGTAIVTVPIANGTLALALGRAGRLPRWGVGSLWAVTPLLPILLLGGTSLGGLLPVVLGALALGWVAVGLALRTLGQ
jgi:hypothetical protein